MVYSISPASVIKTHNDFRTWTWNTLNQAGLQASWYAHPAPALGHFDVVAWATQPWGMGRKYQEYHDTKEKAMKNVGKSWRVGLTMLN